MFSAHFICTNPKQTQCPFPYNQCLFSFSCLLAPFHRKHQALETYMGTTQPIATYHVATLHHVKSRTATSFILRHHCDVLHLFQLLILLGHLRALKKMAAWPFQVEGFLEGSKDSYNKMEEAATTG